MKIQYVIVRNDTGYSKGATAAQAVHSAVLCYRDNSTEEFSSYFKEGFNMRTVILQGTKEELSKLVISLTAKGIKHSVWIEQPEGEVTAVAVCPYDKSYLRSIKELSSLKLY